jgi:hypothetical protein
MAAICMRKAAAGNEGMIVWIAADRKHFVVPL